MIFRHAIMNNLYPTALEGCRGSVFTHGVRMGVQAVGRAVGKVCPACISGTIGV